jgi:hypothetical protein
MFQRELQLFFQHGLQLNHGMDRSYIYNSEASLHVRTSPNCMPSVLIMIARVMERSPYAQKYKNLYEVYQATGTEEITASTLFG